MIHQIHGCLRARGPVARADGVHKWRQFGATHPGATDAITASDKDEAREGRRPWHGLPPHPGHLPPRPNLQKRAHQGERRRVRRSRRRLWPRGEDTRP